MVPEASTLLLMSATCQPCREVAGAMNTAGLPSDVQPLVLLTGGGRPADELESLIAGASRAIVRDPQATQIAEGLSIVSTPFALSISNGLVRAKSYVRTLDDLQELSSLASEQSEEERAVSEEVAS